MLPFIAQPPGDPQASFDAAVSAAEHWGLARPKLMRHGMNTLFTAGDDVVLRVGRPTTDPAAAIWLGEWLTERGLRVPRFFASDIVVAGELSVFAQVREPAAGSIDWAEVGAMVARLHACSVDEIADVSAHYPTPPCMSFPWWDFDALLDDIGSDLDEAARAGIDRVIAGSNWRNEIGEVVLCHGDVHPGNVIAAVDGPVLLDWDLLSLGPRAWDHGPLMNWTSRWGGAPGVYETFADGYGSSLRGEPVAEVLAELRLVAATLMRVRAGRTDPVAAKEAELRLRYWRGDPTAPAWTAA